MEDVSGEPVEFLMWRPGVKMEASGFEKFSERARKVLSQAQAKAHSFSHPRIGAGHILLALVLETSCVAAEVLVALGVELEQLTAALESVLERGEGLRSATLGLTSGAMRSIETAVDEARRLGRGYVGTEHLLIGLAREEGEVAAEVLRSMGVGVDDIKTELTRMQG